MTDVKNLLACKSCQMLSDSEQLKARKADLRVCPNCGGQLTREWQGYIAVIDFEKSDIAKAMGISKNGKYALKVR